MRLFTTLFLTLCLMTPLISSTAHAEDHAKAPAKDMAHDMAKEEMKISDLGPKVGEIIPSDLALIDQNGDTQSFEALSGENGLVLFFVRSVKWCPYCQLQLVDENTAYSEFQSEGYNVAALSYDSLEDIQRFHNKYTIEFPILSDEGSATIKNFGLFNDEHIEGSKAYGVPHPMVFVIGADKTIQAKFSEESYRERPSRQEILESITD